MRWTMRIEIRIVTVPSFGEACDAKEQEYVRFPSTKGQAQEARTPSTIASAYLMRRLPPSSVRPSCPHCHGMTLRWTDGPAMSHEPL